MTFPLALLGVVALSVVGALPYWPYSRGWGFYPFYALSFVLMILLLTALFSHTFD